MTRRSSFPPPSLHSDIRRSRRRGQQERRGAQSGFSEGEISPRMAGERGFIPWLRSLRGRIESQLLKGRMTLKTEFTVIWFFTLYFHYTAAGLGVAARLKSKHDCELDAGPKRAEWEMCFRWSEESKRASG